MDEHDDHDHDHGIITTITTMRRPPCARASG